MPSIAFVAVCKRYGDTKVVKRIDLLTRWRYTEATRTCCSPLSSGHLLLPGFCG
jgi:hypothetical protein